MDAKYLMANYFSRQQTTEKGHDDLSRFEGTNGTNVQQWAPAATFSFK